LGVTRQIRRVTPKNGEIANEVLRLPRSRIDPEEFIMRTVGKLISVACLITCAADTGRVRHAFAAAGDRAAPADWSTAAPREELRPTFSYASDGGRDAQGGFIIQAQREGLDGWWTTTVSVEGGRHYRFHATRKVEGVALPRQTAVARVVWQDDNAQSVPSDAPGVGNYLKGWKLVAEPEFPTDRETDAEGWTEVSDVYLAPSKATRAVIELHLQWAPPGGRIEWSE
jgi:hypothetical protein